MAHRASVLARNQSLVPSDSTPAPEVMEHETTQLRALARWIADYLYALLLQDGSCGASASRYGLL
jgi:hypothetical protein